MRFAGAAALAVLAAGAPAWAEDTPAAAARATNLAQAVAALDTDDSFAAPRAAVERGQAILADPAFAALDVSLQARALHYVALALVRDQKVADALPLLRRADALLMGAGRAGMGGDAEAVRGLLAEVVAMTGDLDAGLALALETEARRSAADPASKDRAEGLMTLGTIYMLKGQVAQSLAAHEQAAQRAEAWADRAEPFYAVANDGLATALVRSGDLARGMETSRKAALFAESAFGMANVLTLRTMYTYAALLNMVARFDEATPVFRRVLAAQEAALGRENPSVGLTMNGLAYSLAKSGRLEEADALMMAATDILERFPDPGGPEHAGLSMMAASNIAEDRGLRDIALQRRERAVAMMERVLAPGHAMLAAPYWGVGQSLLQRGRAGDAVPYLRKSAAIFAANAQAYDPQRVRVEMTLAEALVKAGDVPGGMAIARPTFAAVRDRLDAIDLATADFVRVEQAYRNALGELAETAFLAGEDEMAFAALQYGRFGDFERSSRSLAMRNAAQSAQGSALLERLRVAGERVRTLRQEEARAIGGADASASEGIAARLRAATAELAAAEAAIDAALPGLRAVGRPRPQPLASLRAGLAEDGALLFVQPTINGLLTAVVTREGSAWTMATDGAQALPALVRSIRQSVDPPEGAGALPPFPLADAARLRAAIVAPAIEQTLAGKRQLAVLAAGYAATIPFALLPERGAPGADGPGWLVERFAISTPLSLDPAARRPGRASGGLRMAGIGNPALAPAQSATTLAALTRGGEVDAASVRQLSSLPETARELRSIAQVLGGAGNLVLTGAQATEQGVRAARLGDYDLVVFATHGLASGELGGLQEPALVLTPPAEGGDGMAAGDDGLLTASEIAQLQLDSDWVILSACNTAAGEGLGTPSLSGLARAFVVAGARGLMLSHWRVRDDAAARLTVDTVRGTAAGLSRAEALRRAQLALMADATMADAAHPAVWAPFVVIAD